MTTSEGQLSLRQHHIRIRGRAGSDGDLPLPPLPEAGRRRLLHQPRRAAGGPPRSRAGRSRPSTTSAESGQPVQRLFCGNCGSPIVSYSDGLPGVAFIKAGTLEDTSWLKPTMEIWCETAQPWVPIDPVENPPRTATRPPGRERRGSGRFEPLARSGRTTDPPVLRPRGSAGRGSCEFPKDSTRMKEPRHPGQVFSCEDGHLRETAEMRRRATGRCSVRSPAMRLGLLPKKALDAAAAPGKNERSRDDKAQRPDSAREHCDGPHPSARGIRLQIDSARGHRVEALSRLSALGPPRRPRRPALGAGPLCGPGQAAGRARS